MKKRHSMRIKSKMLIPIVTLSLVTNIYADGSNPAFGLGTEIGQSIGNGIKSLFSSSDEKKEDTEQNKAATSSGGIGGFFGSLFKDPTPEEILAKAPDKDMTQAFLTGMKQDNKLQFSQSKKAMVFDNVVVPFDSAHTFGEARSLCMNIDTIDDPIANTFKSVATNRGNYYTVYSGALNAAIMNAMFGQLPPSNGDSEYYKYDFDNAIVEFAPDGTIVSALTRMDKITLNMMIHPNNNNINYYNIKISQISRIFSKNDLSIVSRLVSKRTFDDNLISTSKVEPKPVAIASTQPSATDTTTKLKELFELYKAGALTKEEFDSEKSKILNNTSQASTPPSTPPKESTHSSLNDMINQKIMESFNKQNGTN
jgi:hypothetical protein